MRVFGLDVARAVAIFLVLVAHLVHEVEYIGFYGVELFFALSGFLIGGILLESYKKADRFNISLLINFWLRRWWRTLPNYYLFICIFLICHGLKGYFPSYEQLLRFVTFTQCTGGNQFFFSVSWSLCIEEWFYLLFPIPLLLVPLPKHVRSLAFCANVVFL